MHLHMVIGVTHTGFDGIHQCQLFTVKIFYQLREITAALASIGASQVGGVTVIFGTGVKQEA
ncbi:hypothetical protein D3C73_1299560 [compost metagenome]